MDHNHVSPAGGVDHNRRAQGIPHDSRAGSRGERRPCQKPAISPRIDGSIFDNYRVDAEFYDEISATSPYSVYKIQAPVLVINALDDPYANPENVLGMAEKFPNARLVVFPDGGHELPGHAVEESAEVQQFLRKNAAAAGMPPANP